MGPSVKVWRRERLRGEAIRVASGSTTEGDFCRVPRRKDAVEKQRKEKRSSRRKGAVGAKVRRPGRISTIRNGVFESLTSCERMGSRPVRQRRWMRSWETSENGMVNRMEEGFCWRARLAFALCSFRRGREMPCWRIRSRVAEPPIFSRAFPRNFFSRSAEVLERRESNWRSSVRPAPILGRAVMA